MAISTAQKRAWLNWCYETDTGTDLRAALVVQRNARANELKSGQVVASTSAISHAVSFSAPSQIGWHPGDLFEFWGEMVELFDSCKADLVTAGDATPSDAEVLEEMLARLPAGAVSYTTNYAGVLP